MQVHPFISAFNGRSNGAQGGHRVHIDSTLPLPTLRRQAPALARIAMINKGSGPEVILEPTDRKSLLMLALLSQDFERTDENLVVLIRALSRLGKQIGPVFHGIIVVASTEDERYWRENHGDTIADLGWGIANLHDAPFWEALQVSYGTLLLKRAQT